MLADGLAVGLEGMKRVVLAALFAAAFALVAFLLFWWPKPPGHPPVGSAELPAPCRDLAFEAVDYVVCEIDLRRYDVGLFHHGTDGRPFGSMKTFDDTMAAEGKPVALAMNAGMYHEDLSPVGLYVEGGRTQSPLNSGDGAGNFFLKPIRQARSSQSLRRGSAVRSQPSHSAIQG